MVIDKGSWITVYLCKGCGIVDAYPQGGLTCPVCGQTGTYMADVVQTSRRFCYSFRPRWFEFWRSVEGAWEYSGKFTDGERRCNVTFPRASAATRTIIMGAAISIM